jgi:hypothetical protein
VGSSIQALVGSRCGDVTARRVGPSMIVASVPASPAPRVPALRLLDAVAL